MKPGSIRFNLVRLGDTFTVEEEAAAQNPVAYAGTKATAEWQAFADAAAKAYPQGKYELEDNWKFMVPVNYGAYEEKSQFSIPRAAYITSGGKQYRVWIDVKTSGFYGGNSHKVYARAMDEEKGVRPTRDPESLEILDAAGGAIKFNTPAGHTWGDVIGEYAKIAGFAIGGLIALYVLNTVLPRGR